MKLLLIDNLLLITFFGACLSTVLNKILTNKIFAPSTAYWLGWLMAIGAADLCNYLHILQPISFIGRELIVQFHIGAFIGFSLSTFLASIIMPKNRTNNFGSGIITSRSFEQLIIGLTKFLIIASLLHLAYRIFRVGDFSLEGFYYNTRYTYIYEDKGLITRIFFYIAPAITLPLIYLGANAAIGRSNKKLMTMTFATILINSLATGSRAGIFAGILFFLFAYLSYFETGHNKISFTKKLLSNYKKGIIVLLVLVALFEGLAAWRNYDGEILGRKSFIGVPWWVPTTFIRYAALPTVASSELAYFIPKDSQLLGQMSFSWLASQLYRVGITDEPITEKIFYRRDLLFLEKPGLAFTQPTAVLDIAADFGYGNVWLVAILLMGIIQFLYFYFNKEGIINLIIVSNACMAAFLVNNASWFLNGATIISLFWAILLYIIYKNRKSNIKVPL